jgi:hypothetical protein
LWGKFVAIPDANLSYNMLRGAKIGRIHAAFGYCVVEDSAAMNTMRITLLGLACICAARADFSYTQTRKGGPGGPAASGETKLYYKGQKMASVSGATSSILDFDAQTVTTINHAQKTYMVTRFSDLGHAMKEANVDASVEVKQTGQKKNINGYNAIEVLMTMAMETPESARAGMKMGMEVSTWLSPDVPGTQELRAFYQKNRDRFPWTAMAGGAGSGMQKAMADAQKEIAKLGGVPLLQVIRMKSGGSAQQAAAMQQMQAQMEVMRKAGGAQAQAAERAMAAMGGGSAIFEITMESTGFSTSTIPDSVFAAPAGYQRK